MYDFDIYQGKPKSSFNTSLGISADEVVNLTSSLLDKHNLKVFAENYFTSFPLIVDLRKRNIKYVRKITGSRMKKCKLLSEKDVKKQGRGEFDFRVDIALNVVAVRWYDNKSINIVSLYVSIEPHHTVCRYDRSLKQKVNVKQPNIVYVFNQYIVDIDKLDMICALYKRRLRTQRRYIYIWFHTIQITVVNAWFLYRGDLKICRPMALLKQFKCYRVELGESLIKVTSSG